MPIGEKIGRSFRIGSISLKPENRAEAGLFEAVRISGDNLWGR